MAEGIKETIRARTREAGLEASTTDEGAALLDIVECVLDSKALLELVKEVMA